DLPGDRRARKRPRVRPRARRDRRRRTGPSPPRAPAHVARRRVPVGRGRRAVTATSRIYDSGYRRYDGPRLGAAHAARALVTHTLQRVFGLHRPARTKVLPILATAIAYLPPAVFVGLAAFLPKQLSNQTLPRFGDIYGFITAAVLVFVIFVAPEALCPD